MSDDKPSQGLYLLTIGVMLLGTLLFILGTRDDGGAHANERQRTSRLGEVGQPPPKTTELAERGAALQQLKCAGCHAGNRRTPSPAVAKMHSAVSHSSLSGEFGRTECQFSQHYDAAPRETTTIMNVPGFILGRSPAPGSDSAVGR